MILADITIKWNFNYEMDPEEQIWHEKFTDTFKFKFDRWLQSCGVNSSSIVIFDLIYFPAVRKFFLKKISLNQELFAHHLQNDHKFYTSYFLESWPEEY